MAAELVLLLWASVGRCEHPSRETLVYYAAVGKDLTAAQVQEAAASLRKLGVRVETSQAGFEAYVPPRQLGLVRNHPRVAEILAVCRLQRPSFPDCPATGRGSYFIQISELLTDLEGAIAELERHYGFERDDKYESMWKLAARLTPAQARKIARDPRVIEVDGECESASPPPLDASCHADADCELVLESLCNCANAGKRVAVNHESARKQRAWAAGKSGVCPAMVSNDPSCRPDARALCTHDRCTVGH